MFRRGLFPEPPETALMKRFQAEMNRPYRGKQRSFLPQLFPEFTRDFYWNPLENGTPYKMLKMSALSGFRS